MDNQTKVAINAVDGVGVNHGTVHQNNGVTVEFHAEIVAPYKKTIQLLENELSRSISPEKQQKLNNELAEHKQQLASKEEELVDLQQFLAQSSGEILKEAEQILNTQGLAAALTYLQNPKHTQQENQIAAQMLGLADKYRFEANLLQLNNQYAKAQAAYESMLKYDRSAPRLFACAHYLQKQNEFLGATTYYQEALGLYRNLAASNPSVFEPNVAMTLSNLAVLYRQQNQMVQAKDAYIEALVLYRKLAVSNPSVYEPNVARTLNNLAVFYFQKKQMAQAEATCIEALVLFRNLAASNPSVYEPDVAMTLNNLANLYSQQNQMAQAQDAYIEALDLYRKLAASNPSVYEPNVATTLNNLANLYCEQNQMAQAQDAFIEALGFVSKTRRQQPNTLHPFHS